MAAQRVPTDKGLLALLYKVHTEPSVRDRFRDPQKFDALMTEFEIDKPTSNLVLSLGVADIVNKTGQKDFPDKALYTQLLNALYDQQLGKNEHFTFAW